MLPKANRLNLRTERFFRGDRQVTDKYLKVLAKKAEGQVPKIGFVVSGKVGKATERNRVRRLISSVIENSLEKIPGNLQLIFIAFPQSADATRSEIEDNVKKILTKI